MQKQAMYSIPIHNQANHVIRCISPKEVFDLAWRLVSIPSHSDMGNHALVKWLAEFLAKEDLQPILQSVVEGKHQNLIIEKPGIHGGYRLLLNGHLDTVPPPLMTLPAELRLERLYGRGATDMKGAVAAMLMALIALQRARIPLQYGVIFTGVAGEEIGGIGTKAFLDAGGRANMAIIGEPTNLSLVTAQKGIEWIKIEIDGKAAHASCPEIGVNAITWGSRVVQALDELAVILKKRNHPLLGTPSLSIGMINGGIANGIVPERCVIELDRRWLPNESSELIYKEIETTVSRSLQDTSGLHFRISRSEETKHCIPVETPSDSTLVSTTQDVLHDHKLPYTVHGVPYGTDASYLSHFDIPTVILGPGDIRQAHSDNEFVELVQLWQATILYIDIILRLCTSRNTGVREDQRVTDTSLEKDERKERGKAVV